VVEFFLAEDLSNLRSKSLRRGHGGDGYDVGVAASVKQEAGTPSEKAKQME
jgi:hypothetical protein